MGVNLAFSRSRKADVGLNVEERLVRQGEFDMRLVINRPHSLMRMMDYRAGNYEEKRDMLDALAGEEGLHKIFTVVEKQDSNSWRSAGFLREGVYPSFFRTADAYMMSRIYGPDGTPTRVDAVKPTAEEKIKFPGRKLIKPDNLTISPVVDETMRAALLAQTNGDLRALPFARVKPPDLVLQAKSRSKKVWACSEIDESFAHATIGFTPTPVNEVWMVLCAYAGNALLQELLTKEVANVFGVSPTNDRWANELFAGLGFKVTGRLAKHLKNGDGHENALLWHRRLEPKAS